jgi:hypothetical protein
MYAKIQFEHMGVFSSLGLTDTSYYYLESVKVLHL